MIGVVLIFSVMISTFIGATVLSALNPILQGSNVGSIAPLDAYNWIIAIFPAVALVGSFGVFFLIYLLRTRVGTRR